MVDRSVSIGLQAQVSGFVAGIKTAQMAAAGFMAELDKSAKKRAALNDLGMTAGKVGLLAGAGLAVAVAAAANFDQAMSRVQGATQDSAKQMELLRTAAINAGRDTVFSATDAASAEEQMAKAGVKTADILGGGLTGALNLASAGTLDVGQAAEIAATTMNQFGLAGSQVTHIADVLAATAGKAQGDVTDMAEALKYVGPVASQMGVSLEQTAGSIGFLASQGILGSQAGTSLRGMLTALTSPSKTAAKEMDNLGITMYDAKGNFIGLDGVAGQLHDHMSNLSNATRDQALGQIFGNQQITAARVLYAGGADAVDKWTKKVNDSGYAARLAATKMDNLKGDLEQLKGSLETALIGTGEGAQTPLRSLVQHITSAVNAYSNLGDGAKQNVAKVLGATALLGGSVFVLSKTVIGINSTVTALKALGVTAATTKVMLKGMVAAGIIVGLERLAEATLNADNNAKDLTQTLRLMALGVQAGPNLDFGFKNLGQELKEAAQEGKIFGDNMGVLSHLPGFMQTSDNIKQIDAQLSKLARQDPKAASSAFAAIKEQARQAGVSMRDLMALFPKFEAVINEPRKAKSSLINLGDLLSGLHGLRDYKSELMKLPHEVLTKVVNPGMLKTTKDVVALGKRYKDLDGHDIRVIMRARDFATPEIHKVLKSLGFLDKQHPKPELDADPKSALQKIELSGRAAVRFGDMKPTAVLDANPKPAQSMIQGALHTLGIYGHQHPSATLDANNAPLNAAVAQAQARINSLHGTTVTNTILTVHRGGSQNLATGGPVIGPGTGTSDSVPILASNGEFVVSAAAYKRNRALVHSINAQRFATGGLVGGSSFHGDPAASEVHMARQDAHKHHGENMAALRKQLEATQQFNQSVQQNFRVDPFQANATLQGVMASLASDTTRAQGFSMAAQNAKRLGLNGAVFRGLLASGNTAVLDDITTQSQVQALEAAWRVRNKATADLTFGASPGKLGGDTLKELRHAIDRLQHELHGHGHRVEKGAEKGTRKGTRDNRGHRNRAASRAGLP